MRIILLLLVGMTAVIVSWTTASSLGYRHGYQDAQSLNFDMSDPLQEHAAKVRQKLLLNFSHRPDQDFIKLMQQHWSSIDQLCRIYQATSEPQRQLVDLCVKWQKHLEEPMLFLREASKELG